MNIIRNIKDAKKILHGSYRPQTKAKHIGIEIEMVSPISKELVAVALVNAGLDSYVKVGYDESIDTEDYDIYDDNDSGNHGLELRVLCKQSEVKFVITKLTKILKELDCYVNSSCGLHVHLDMRHRDIITSYINLAAAQGLLYSVTNTSRRNSYYCSPVTYSDYSKYVERKEIPIPRSGINLNSLSKYNTIEIRIHEGTLDSNEIINFVKLLTCIVDRKTATNGWRILKNKALPKATLNYVNKRIKEYGKAKLHKKNYVGA